MSIRDFEKTTVKATLAVAAIVAAIGITWQAGLYAASIEGRLARIESKLDMHIGAQAGK